jgi:3-deoxy-manno-octulosonate cytidylyltransferase (CMP-KDO synthetase)
MIPACYGIIPARYASTRFPGKPLVDLLGKPMFWHVCTRAARCPHLTQVALATDDRRIFEAARKLSVPVVMTRMDHPSGTDRVLEAAEQLQVPDDAVVVNIQGDEPTLQPAMLTELLAPFEAPDTRVTTLVRSVAPDLAATSDVVSVVFSNSGRALYFSRATIPFQRNGGDKPVYEHVGMYAFRMETLKQFVALGPGILERRESLEQLRLLENDIPIQVVITEHVSEDIDRPEDVEKVRRILAQEPQ